MDRENRGAATTIRSRSETVDNCAYPVSQGDYCVQERGLPLHHRNNPQAAAEACHPKFSTWLNTGRHEAETNLKLHGRNDRVVELKASSCPHKRCGSSGRQ